MSGEVVFNKAFRPYLSDSPEHTLVLRGGHIQRYEVIDDPKQGTPVYIDKEQWLANSQEGTAAFAHQKSRVVYQESAALDNWRRIIAAFLPTGNVCGHKICYFVDVRYNDLTFLALFNSSVVEWRFRLVSTTNNLAAYQITAIPIPRVSFTTPPDERSRLVGIGTAEAAEFIAETAEGAASASSASFSAFSDSVFGRWLDERLSPTHTADPALVRQHNADPRNEGWQLPEEGPVEQSDVVHDLLAHLAEQMMATNKDKQAEVKGFLSWLETFLGCPVDDLSGKTYVRAYHERTFDELLATLKKNRRRIQPDLDRRGPLEALRAEWDTSMGKLRPLLARIAATDRLIDLIVYRLYRLTEDEVAVVEGAAT